MRNTHIPTLHRKAHLRPIITKAALAVGLAAAAVAAPVAASAHESTQPAQISARYWHSPGYSWTKTYHWDNTSYYVYKYQRSTGKVWVFVKQRDGSYRLCKIQYCIPWCAVPAKDPKPEQNIEPFSAPTTGN